MLSLALRIVALACLVVSGLLLAQPSAPQEPAYASDSSGEDLGERAETDESSEGPRVILNHSLRREFTIANPLENVTVRGRAPPSAYRRRIVAAAETTWATFNEANSDDRFDVHCSYEAPTGSRIVQHVCRPQFLDDATNRAARAFLQLDKGASIGMQQFEMNNVHYMQRQLEDEMRGLASSDPVLREQVETFNELLENYEEARANDDK